MAAVRLDQPLQPPGSTVGSCSGSSSSPDPSVPFVFSSSSFASAVFSTAEVVSAVFSTAGVVFAAGSAADVAGKGSFSSSFPFLSSSFPLGAAEAAAPEDPSSSSSELSTLLCLSSFMRSALSLSLSPDSCATMKTRFRRFGTPFHLEPKHVMSHVSAVL